MSDAKEMNIMRGQPDLGKNGRAERVLNFSVGRSDDGVDKKRVFNLLNGRCKTCPAKDIFCKGVDQEVYGDFQGDRLGVYLQAILLSSAYGTVNDPESIPYDKLEEEFKHVAKCGPEDRSS